MADLAVLQSRLAEAESALHDLQIGKRVVEVWRDGRRVTFTSAQDSIGNLESYITELTGQIATITGVASTDWRSNRRAARFVFK